MADEVRLAKADLKRPAAAVPVTMQGLWRLVVWGSTAAAVLLVAVLSSRGVVGSHRAAVAAATIGNGTAAIVQPVMAPPPQAAANAFDAQAETKRLADSVRELASENDQLKARIGMVEHGMDDITGSIAQEVKTAAAAAAPPWPDNATPVPSSAAEIAAVMAPALPLPMEYGVDIGTAVSIQALRARWAGIRSAHPQLFDGLAPTVSLSEMPASRRPELRLVVGPLVSAGAAAKLCTTLERYRLTCQPTIFAGRHLALD
ncbi:MAG TPA: hypothetical protein VK749_08365, partial [Xanthobacteraceae bacterium]|nr:hypothetical protein [Xanthobacteraceae bacterium]